MVKNKPDTYRKQYYLSVMRPLFSITCRNLVLNFFAKLWQHAGGAFTNSSRHTASNSDQFINCLSRTLILKYDHRFSIGLRSGDWDAIASHECWILAAIQSESLLYVLDRDRVARFNGTPDPICTHLSLNYSEELKKKTFFLRDSKYSMKNSNTGGPKRAPKNYRTFSVLDCENGIL